VSVQAGIWNFDGRPVSREFLSTISQSTAAYGPDGEATYCEGPVAMLYRPFHTTAESRIEQQPYSFGADSVITYDGRLDNREDLLHVLGPNLNGSATDVAVAAAAFERWGTDAFAKLIGDWALSIWNARQQELLLARDFVGIKHLYYYIASNLAIWCSHLEPLARCGDQFSVCDEYVAGYLALWPDAELTPYCAIRCVGPGKWVRLSDRRATSCQYWRSSARRKIRYRTDGEYEEHFRHLFRQSVRRRLRTDSPVLAELSGGLDSSAIVCMADDIRSREGQQIPRVRTLSYYDFNEPSEDDHIYFEKVEKKRGSVGFHIDLGSSRTTLAIEAGSFPLAPGLELSGDLKAARSQIVHSHGFRVTLAGVGGDELLGQALDPRVLLADMLITGRLRKLASQLTQWSLLVRRPWIHLLLQSLALLLPSTFRSRFTAAARVDSWIDKRFARQYKIGARQLGIDCPSLLWLPSQRDHAQTLTFLARRMNYMAPTNEETRYPYMDRDLVEFLASIPTEQLLRPGERRSLMRRALKDLLPVEVLKRRTKAGAARSYSVFLEESWKVLEVVLTSLLSEQAGYLNQAQFRAVLVAMKAGQLSPYFVRVIKGLSLEMWLRATATRGLISFPRTSGGAT
jgi:asparagine synthase (glutamine-hydrolysing)